VQGKASSAPKFHQFHQFQYYPAYNAAIMTEHYYVSTSHNSDRL